MRVEKKTKHLPIECLYGTIIICSANEPKTSSNLRFCFIKIAPHRILLEGLWLLMLGSQKSQQLKKICFQGHWFWCIRFNYRRGCIEKKMVRSGLFYQQYFYKFSLAVGLTFDRIKGQQSIKTFMTLCLLMLKTASSVSRWRPSARRPHFRPPHTKVFD